MLGWLLSTIAAAPATCGQAIDVPLITRLSVSEFLPADRIFEPGAKMSTQGPWLEKLDMLSETCVEPTVIAVGTNAGEN
jgi:hypothetical protein